MVRQFLALEHDDMTISLSRLQTFYGHLEANALLRVMIKEEFAGSIALISSFGADSALLLSMVAAIDPATPVLFLETGKHFDETLVYVEELKSLLGLTDVRMLKPDLKLLNNADPNGDLWKHQPNRCCWIRKVEPLERAIKDYGFQAVVTGRKAYQTADRADLSPIEHDENGIFKINPFINWDKEQFKAAVQDTNLPQHPLVDKGFLSIGCEPCTVAVKPGEDERSGRWAHTVDMREGQKTECGIHVPQDVNWEV